MDSGLTIVAREIDRRLQALSAERFAEGGLSPNRGSVKLLGQLALFADGGARSHLHLARTRDVDALIESDWSVRAVVKEVFRTFGYVYDELSGEVWIPPGATYNLLYESPLLTFETLDPLYVLTSKAIKAPEKNRLLVAQGIALYGDRLIDLIVRHGGRPTDFVHKP